MARNPWDGDADQRSRGNPFGSGDAFGATDFGQMDAVGVQNRSHTGPHLSEGELHAINDRITQMVAEGRDVRDIPGQFPGVDANLIQQYIQQAQTRTDFNPFDNMPGNPQPAQQEQGEAGQGVIGAMLGGAVGLAAVSRATPASRAPGAAEGEVLHASGVATDGKNLPLSMLGSLVPGITVGQGRDVGGPALA